MQQRPTSVTVFGIINIIFGSFNIICLPISLLMATGVMRFMRSPVLDLLSESHPYVIWTTVGSIIGIFAAIVQLVCGIGLLKLKPWARTTSIGYAIYAIIAAIAGMFMTAVVMIPIMQKIQPGSGPDHAVAIGGMVGGIIGGIAGSCFALIYPIILLIFMTRPKIKAAFVAPQP